MAGPCSASGSDWGPDDKADDLTVLTGTWFPGEDSVYQWIGPLFGSPPGISAGDIPYFNVLDFGAKAGAGSGVQDDAHRIQLAIDAALVSGVGAVFIPRGSYTARSPINVSLADGQSLRIFSDFAALQVDADKNFTWPVTPNTAGAMLSLSSEGRPLVVERLYLNCMHKAPVCVSLENASGPMVHVRHLITQFAADKDIRVVQCKGVSFLDCYADHSGGDGWYIEGCKGASFIGCCARQNARNGFCISGSSVAESGACFVSHVLSEGNGGCGICIWEGDPGLTGGHATGVRVRDGWIEGNYLHGVRIAAWDVEVAGLKIVGGTSPSRCIMVDKEASGVMVRDCAISLSAGDYGVPLDEAGQARFVFFDHNYATSEEGDNPCSPDETRARLVVPKAV